MQQRRRSITLHRLADTLYYHQGATLSHLSRWNEMTKLQMQHELLKRGKLDDGEETSLTEWKLRLRLVCVMTEEKKAWKEGAKERRCKEEEASRLWIAQCRAYKDEDDDNVPMDLTIVEEKTEGVC
jgi:hypothetical protein